MIPLFFRRLVGVLAIWAHPLIVVADRIYCRDVLWRTNRTSWTESNRFVWECWVETFWRRL